MSRLSDCTMRKISKAVKKTAGSRNGASAVERILHTIEDLDLDSMSIRDDHMSHSPAERFWSLCYDPTKSYRTQTAFHIIREACSGQYPKRVTCYHYSSKAEKWTIKSHTPGKCPHSTYAKVKE